MTINVVAALTVKPGRAADFEKAVALARAQVILNPACHRYDLQRVRRSEQEYVMLETWESTAALKEHDASDAFASFGAQLADLVAAPPTVTVHEPVGEQVPLSPTN
jgi:quinol monooxygenase YgiN